MKGVVSFCTLIYYVTAFFFRIRCDNCKFSIHFSRTELAEYLQIDRSALSRELGRIKNDGIIDYHRSDFHILKPEKLIY